MVVVDTKDMKDTKSMKSGTMAADADPLPSKYRPPKNNAERKQS